MEKWIYLVYKTDKQYHDPILMGCFSSKENAIDAIVKNNEIDCNEFLLNLPKNLTHAEREMERNRIISVELEYDYRTLGYEPNYLIEIWPLDKWNLTK